MEAAVDELAPLTGYNNVILSKKVEEEPATMNANRRRRIVAVGAFCIATLAFFGCSFLMNNRRSIHTTASLASTGSTTSLEAAVIDSSYDPPADADDTPSLTPAQSCGAAFVQLQFNIFNYDAYNTYFDESSYVELAQTGVYKGPDAIEEYVKFVDDHSPYIQARRNYAGESAMTGFDPMTNICKFTTYFIEGVDFDPALTPGNTVNFGGILHSYYSAVTNKISTIHVYYTAPLTLVFFTQLQTKRVDDFVCDVLLGQGCLAELGDQAERGLTKHKCLKRLSHLPLAEGEEHWVDGKTQGCRYLHSVFALTNTYHCAHVSLIPAEDPKGNIKCQTSAYVSPKEFFTQTEIDRLYDLCGRHTSLGLDQDTCVHLIKRHHPSSKKSKKSSDKSSKKSSKKETTKKETRKRQ